MNYLAHSFLSFTDAQIVGNLIEDFMKGRDRKALPREVQEGIYLHRRIDTFTDAHPVIHEAKKVFSPLVRLYSGAFVDVVLDYFLANDPNLLTIEGWRAHSQKVYRALCRYETVLPPSFLPVFQGMQEGDWLFNYRYRENIGHSMQNVLNKARYLEKDLPVYQVFLENEEFLGRCYHKFFPELKNYIVEIKPQLQGKLF